jgi:hypothetical protein
VYVNLSCPPSVTGCLPGLANPDACCRCRRRAMK